MFIDKIINKINNKKRLISIIVLSVLALLMFLAFVTKRRVYINKSYYAKEDVALYLKKYHELPKNYYIKSSSDSRTYDADVLGGFIHDYDSSLPKSLKNANFKECDIYCEGYSASSRGELRLVYTCNTNNVRVFYTDDHYNVASEITNYSINKVSIIFNIIFTVSASLSVPTYFIVRKKIKDSENVVDFE